MLTTNSDGVVQPERSVAVRPVAQMILGGIVIPLLVLLGLGVVVFKVLRSASSDLHVPKNEVLLVHTTPDESAPLLARFGTGHTVHVTGRSADWRWLEVETWDGERGWALRPLGILVWQIIAVETTPTPHETVIPVTLIPEEMIAVPGSTFNMGSPTGIGENDESPVHVVTLSPYLIDRTEVTIGNYWLCVGSGACSHPVANDSSTEPHYINDPTFDNYPVIHVTWEQASAYCNWRGKRLPTEAEWEMAAGWNAALGAKLFWPWGHEAGSGMGNIGGLTAGPMAVGSNPTDQSPNGVMDMGGNVREWVLDWYKVNYYSSADDSDPRGPTYRRGEGQGRVVRGGSYADNVELARTANRGHDDPAYGQATIGFRCAQDQ